VVQQKSYVVCLFAGEVDEFSEERLGDSAPKPRPYEASIHMIYYLEG